MTTRAVALVSGGIDSATAAAVVRAEGVELYPIAIDYGQRHAVELGAARRICEKLGFAPLKIVKIDLRAIGGSALTGAIDVPKRRAIDRSIPITYVPARNTIFLAVALGYAETLCAFDIVIGVNALDYSGYPDCRGEFLRAFEALAKLATKAGVEDAGCYRIRAPLLHWSKAEIIKKGAALGVPLEWTHSCYDPAPSGAPCGACDSCQIRARGFAQAGVPDPALHATKAAGR